MSKMPEFVRNAETGRGRHKDVSDEIRRRQIREAVDDPNADIDVDVVFARLEDLHAKRVGQGR
ncbi:type II toxin-antitoxin system ParD family antitoxin [Rhizobium sp. K102]|jgi:antitoxin ParD1/3/4|uniref:type II toxin-antitoxin system ParD family antitoxin n=1 Tax=Rhizobium sp. K102 TaxID=2918527 RepID=UPI001EFB346C|nr:type II toxin-antitoxin system ParD family antitoxin [Rhizobium sp. K102]ULR43222.1 type II toxin-antitoxin system ParD family antitoxin [Rhizobium sp. K102]